MYSILSLILAQTFIYSLILLLRKKFVLTKIPLELFIIFSGLFNLIIMSIIIFYKKINIFSTKNIKGIKESLITLIGILLIQTANWYIFLYLLQNNDISVIVPLNQIFIVIFSSLLGYLLLNEKITNKKVFGIFLTGISIILINVK
jgi:drug/metabolite transporter (DMT)-like permease